MQQPAAVDVVVRGVVVRAGADPRGAGAATGYWVSAFRESMEDLIGLNGSAATKCVAA